MDTGTLRTALRKQGIHVHESDPVLEIAAICEVAVAGAVTAIEGLNKAAVDRISAASAQQVEAAKQVASTLITEAGAWSADHLRATAAELSASIQKELRADVAKAEAAARVSVRVAWVVGGVGAVALAGMTGFWLAGL